MREAWTKLKLRVRALWRRRELERDLAEEIAFHVAMRNGETRGFGNPTRIEEDLREMWTFPGIESVWQDVRYAWRVMLRSPVFTLVAVGSLAIGIGANTAMFSLVRAMLLKSLPVASPEQLRVVLWKGEPRYPNFGSSGYMIPWKGERIASSFSFAAYESMAARVSGMAELMGFAKSQVTVASGDESHYARMMFATGNMGAVLGVKPLYGRLLGASDDTATAAPATVMTHRYWMKHFGGDPSVVGREVRINGKTVTVAGVLEEGFQGLDRGGPVDMLVPMSMMAEFGSKYYVRTDPRRWWVQMVGRLRPGASGEALGSALAAVMKQMDEQHPVKKNAKRGPWRPVVLEAAQGLPLLRNQAEKPLMVLSGVMGLVLLIACANIANLLLARSAARGGEVAVRLSIGAGRWRLVRQFLTESVLLAVIGAGLGLMVAKPLAEGTLALADNVSEMEVEIDGEVLLFTAGATMLTALLFGLVPALRATRVDLTPSLKQGAAGARGRIGQLKLSRALIVAQVALCVLLLTGAGLFVRTLGKLTAIDPGFNTRQLVLFNLDASRSGYEPERLVEFYEQARARLAELPGVEGATYSSEALLSQSMSNTGIRMAGEKDVRQENAHNLRVGVGFFRLMGIGMVAGREIEARDHAKAPRVAVVNEEFVKRFLGGRNALGRRFHVGTFANLGGEDPAIEIIGVCRNARYESLRSELPATVYMPYSQPLEWAHGATFELRTAMDAAVVGQEAKRLVARMDTTVPLSELRTQEAQIRETLGSERMFAALVGGFGVTAALLAAIGLYGLMAYAVARRRAEIGIRLALGAGRGEVRWMVVRDSLAMVALGLVVGVPAALALSDVVRSMLYGVEARDPLSVAGAGAAMLAVALASAWAPAVRASRVDPVEALRCE